MTDGPRGHQDRRRQPTARHLAQQRLGIEPTAELDGIRIHDIAPTLLYGMGLPVAEDFAGRAWVELFDASFRRRFPLHTVPTWGVGADGSVTTSAEDEALVRELRALGYLD